MEKTDLPCAAARDLMPLVKDGLASPQSRALVENHIQSCPACRAEWEALPAEAPPLESAPLASLGRKLNRQSLSRALVWALSALLAASLVLVGVTHRTPVPYGPGVLRLHSVVHEGELTGQELLIMDDPAADYMLTKETDAETGEGQTLLTAWTTLLTRWRGSRMPRATLVSGELWYASFDGTEDVRVLPDGAESTEPSRRMTLPRLALGYYWRIAAAVLALSLAAFLALRGRPAARLALHTGLLSLCYLLGHLSVLGFGSASVFMGRDLVCILLVALLLYGVALAGLWRKKMSA